MDFRLSQEQELLRDGARRYFAADGGFDQRKRQPAVTAAADWQQFAGLGWLAMAVPEDYGGLGAGIEDLAILCEELGRGLSPAPFIGGAVLPARVLQRCASPLRLELLGAIAANTRRLALAAYEPDRRYALDAGAHATPQPDGSWRLHGRKSLVAGGAQAQGLIVSAHVGGGTALLLVEADGPGIKRRCYPTIDGVEVADFEFGGATVPAANLLAGADTAPAILGAALDEARVCLCAEVLGGMDQVIRLTADYLKLRKQFGRPLAEFQALQHGVAELCIEADSARSVLYRAIAALAGPEAQRGRAVAGCCIKLMAAAKQVAGSGVHLHGGIGMSCEYPVGHYLRRVLVAERSLGDREHHLARYLA